MANLLSAKQTKSTQNIKLPNTAIKNKFVKFIILCRINLYNNTPNDAGAHNLLKSCFLVPSFLVLYSIVERALTSARKLGASAEWDFLRGRGGDWNKTLALLDSSPPPPCASHSHSLFPLSALKNRQSTVLFIIIILC